MKTIHIVPIVALAAAALMSGCASNDSGQMGSGQMGSQSYAVYGVVQSINMSNASSSGINAGAVIGGVVGAVAGNQVGGGRGNTLATVAGAVGGAAIGSTIESQNAAQMYNIQVRLDNGNYETITQKGSVADLRVGDRVRIENGQAYRA